MSICERNDTILYDHYDKLGNMVASKRIHCVICDKKCSGNVLRYQDQYYHKQCFELEQSREVLAAERQQQQQQQRWTSASLQRESPHQSTVASPAPLTNSAANLTSTTTTTGNNNNNNNNNNNITTHNTKQSNGDLSSRLRSQTMDSRQRRGPGARAIGAADRSATLPHSSSAPNNGFNSSSTANNNRQATAANCAGCQERILDGQALIALDLHWHVWCFRCAHCRAPLHGEYVAKEGKAYCEKDYQRLFGVSCVYCKRFITGKVLQAGEAHHFHPSCARCSKCGDPFVPGEEMYLQGEVTWHPRCGPGPADSQSGVHLDGELDGSRSQLRSSRAQSPSLSSRSRSASPFSFMSRQYGRNSPYADSEAVGDLSRVYTISYLNADPAQGYLRRPVEPRAPKSPQFSRPQSASRASSRSTGGFGNYSARDRSVPRGMYSVLSSIRSPGTGSSVRARSPSMQNEEAIRLAQFPAAQEPPPDALAKIERDDFPAPPFPFPERRGQVSSTLEPHGRGGQQRSSRPRSREIPALDSAAAGGAASSELPIVATTNGSGGESSTSVGKEEEELSKIANGIGKIFLQTLKERERLRAWKRANLDPRNASRTPSATRELPARLRYDNPTAASPSRDMDRPRHWDEADGGLLSGEPSLGNLDHSPTRTRSSLGKMSASTYGYKVVQSNRYTPKPGYGLGLSTSATTNHINNNNNNSTANELHSFAQQQTGAQNRSADLLSRAGTLQASGRSSTGGYSSAGAHLRRSMPNVASLSQLHSDGPPKLYPYHLLATSNYRLPPDVDRCHLERHLSGEEFQYIFHCDRLDFYRLPEWKRNELKRRAKLF